MACSVAAATTTKTFPVPSWWPHSTLKLEKARSHLPAGRAESGRSSFHTFIALLRCHGYWSITTVSWEPNRHLRSRVTQREKVKPSRPTHLTLWVPLWTGLKKRSKVNVNENLERRGLGMKGRGRGMIGYVRVQRLWLWLCTVPGVVVVPWWLISMSVFHHFAYSWILKCICIWLIFSQHCRRRADPVV